VLEKLVDPLDGQARVNREGLKALRELLRTSVGQNGEERLSGLRVDGQEHGPWHVSVPTEERSEVT
jgi:hypothetical protein